MQLPVFFCSNFSAFLHLGIMKFTTNIFLLLLVFAYSTAIAQVKFEAKVSKNTLGVNERLRIDFEMNQDGDNFVPPSFQDFTVVGGPNTSVSNYWSNGKRSFTKTYSYFLSPKKQANLFDIFFAVNPSHFKLDKQSIVNSLKNQRLDVLYPSYNVVDNEVFPSEIKIKAKQPCKFTNIDFIVKSVEFDTSFDVNFSIPKGYKQIIL